MKRTAVIFILLLAFCGLADSAYLAQHQISGTPLICDSIGFSGCNTVAASPYAKLFGVPLAEIGVLFYGALFVLAAFELALADRRLRRTIQAAAVAGILASIYFVFLQVFFIRAFCIYCTASAVITVLILASAWFIEPSGMRSRRAAPPGSPSLPMPPRS